MSRSVCEREGHIGPWEIVKNGDGEPIMLICSDWECGVSWNLERAYTTEPSDAEGDAM